MGRKRCEGGFNAEQLWSSEGVLLDTPTAAVQEERSCGGFLAKKKGDGQQRSNFMIRKRRLQALFFL